MDVHPPKNGLNRYWPNPIWRLQLVNHDKTKRSSFSHEAANLTSDCKTWTVHTATDWGSHTGKCITLVAGNMWASAFTQSLLSSSFLRILYDFIMFSMVFSMVFCKKLRISAGFPACTGMALDWTPRSGCTKCLAATWRSTVPGGVRRAAASG